MKHIGVDPKSIKKDPGKTRLLIISGRSGDEQWQLSAFRQRFAAQRARTEQFQAKLRFPPTGSSDLIVD